MSKSLEADEQVCEDSHSALDLTKTSWFALNDFKKSLSQPPQVPSIVDAATIISPVDETPQLQVLQNLDLLELIFSFLEWGLYSDCSAVKRNDLLYAALTCTSFFDPVMNVLWRRLPSLVPLLNLLPTYDRHRHTLLGVVRLEDFSRFDVYAHRIRRLDSDTGQTIPAYLYILILRHHRTTLLPSLQKLTVSVTSYHKSNFPGILLTISPSLRDVTLRDISNKIFAANLLHTILIEAPNISELNISKVSHITPVDVDMIMNAVVKFRNLHSLTLLFHLNMLPFDTLAALSNLQSLRSLYISIGEQTNDARESTKPVSFNTLTAFKLYACVNEVSGILSSIYAPILTTLLVDFDGAEDDTTLFAGCIRRCADISESLQSLSLTISFGSAQWSTLKALASCRQLKDMAIICELWPMSDDDLLDLCACSAWRNLESLKLLPNSDTSPYLSLLALSILADHFPRLKRLHTSLKVPQDSRPADDPHHPLSTAGEPQSSHGLEELRIEHASDTKIDKDIFRHVEQVFPNLKKTEIEHDGDTEDDDEDE